MKNITVVFMLVAHCSIAQLYAPNGIVTSTSNSTTGFVGIGSAAPGYMLEVTGNIINSNPQNGWIGLTGDLPGYSVGLYPTLKSNGTLYFSVWNKYSAYINGNDASFGLNDTNANPKVVLNSNGNSYLNGGNLGIGTASPGFKFEVAANNQIAVGKTYVDNCLDIDNAYTRSNFGSNVYWNTASSIWQVRAIGNNDFSAMIHPNGDGLAFITASSDGNADKQLTNSQFMAFERMRINSNGNVGIGTSNPGDKLSVSGGAITMDADQPLRGGGKWLISGNSSQVTVGTSNPSVNLRFDAGSPNRMFVNGSSGYVGIGTTNPDALLAVKGQVHANEVKVDLNVPGPDYVFASDYKLPSLEEIKTYIDQNKHLPEVPSAIEMEQNGVQLGEMNMLLLKKIEELTLLMIEQEKRIRQLENKQTEK